MAEYGVIYVCDKLDLAETKLIEAVEYDIHRNLPKNAYNVRIKWLSDGQFGTSAMVAYEMESN